jgi:hypothetical protein
VDRSYSNHSKNASEFSRLGYIVLYRGRGKKVWRMLVKRMKEKREWRRK